MRSSCTKTGYNTINITVFIVDNQTTIQNFSLTAPEIVINPMTLDVDLYPNTAFDTLITINNNGNGPLTWDANISHNWDLQMTFDVTEVLGVGYDPAAECDGQFFYTTSLSSNLIYKYDLNGTFLEDFSISGIPGMRDLAYDGAYMYGVGGSNLIYKMDFALHTIVGFINPPDIVNTIAYDEEQDGFWVGGLGLDILLISKNSVILDTIPASVHKLEAMGGSTYDN